MNIRDKLNEIIRLNWTEADFGFSKKKADYKRQLAHIYHLDSFNKLKYKGEEVTISASEIMYTTDVNGKEEKFVSAKISKRKRKRKRKMKIQLK